MAKQFNVYLTKTQKARFAHECDECKRTIQPGELNTKLSGYEPKGMPTLIYLCCDCREPGEREIQPPKTHCKHGHEFTEENTRIIHRNGRVERQCKTCTRLNKARYDAAKRELNRKPHWSELAVAENGIIRVPLSANMDPDGPFALIEEADFDLVAPYNWGVRSAGYAAVELKLPGQYYLRMHQLILPPPDGMVVDHINRDKLDNRRSNLRVGTQRENCGNLGMNRNNKTGYRGVSLVKKTGLYQAHIRNHGKSLALGRFANPEDAGRAYDQAALYVFGEFANLNFPRSDYE